MHFCPLLAGTSRLRPSGRPARCLQGQLQRLKSVVALSDSLTGSEANVSTRSVNPPTGDQDAFKQQLGFVASSRERSFVSYSGSVSCSVVVLPQATRNAAETAAGVRGGHAEGADIHSADSLWRLSGPKSSLKGTDLGLLKCVLVLKLSMHVWIACCSSRSQELGDQHACVGVPEAKLLGSGT